MPWPARNMLPVSPQKIAPAIYYVLLTPTQPLPHVCRTIPADPGP